MSRTLVRALLLLAALAWATPAARADRLDLVRNRGELVVGVKADYPPFGMVDPAGRLVGIEADLAADLARRLGTGLRLVAVTSGNRLQKLEEGSIDLIIATLGDTAQRRTIAALLEPGYFSSGANIMLRPGPRPVTEWQDLQGQKVCATLGALFNPVIGQRYLLDLQVFKDNRDVKMAVRDGRCIGWLYDDIAIVNELRNPEWLGYSMPLGSVVTTPWAIALAKSEENGPLARAVSQIVADWHRDGFLIETMRRWQMPVGDYLESMHALWSARDEQGRPVCRMQPDGGWPAACRHESRLTVDDVSGIERLVLLVRERTGLNFSFLRSPFEQQQLMHGVRGTVVLIIGSILGSIALGFLGALLIATRLPVISGTVAGIATFLRMTPPLLQLYIVFFGVGSYIVTRWGWPIDGMLVALLCFSAYAGAANVSAFAEAIRVAQADRRAATDWRRIARLAWPAVTASCVNIAKATGMASAIAVPELVYASSAIVAENGNPSVMMNLLMLVYFLLILAVVWLFGRIERRLAVP
ncbi:MAG TPA: transporter substrate-binding domain-containing protein [Geminicoccaceae bacterium]|nr:transporter substrate-binding domain-containing protein [Geminicoccus sp.]HMU50294.1 transporter substrate-binding domain-containing protein [Geminicoccaceae bacterium]